MRRIVFALLCTTTVAACSTEAVVQSLVAEGWTEHAFNVPGEGVFSYACAPTGPDADARAARAHRVLYAGINDTANRAADDVIAGRLSSQDLSRRIDREVSALTDRVQADTGCLLTNAP